jgi:hypothetical protein
MKARLFSALEEHQTASNQLFEMHQYTAPTKWKLGDALS